MSKIAKGLKRTAFDQAAYNRLGNGLGKVVTVITPNILKEKLVDMKVRRFIKK